jgi:hypothetical protein
MDTQNTAPAQMTDAELFAAERRYLDIVASFGMGLSLLERRDRKAASAAALVCRFEREARAARR